MNAYGFLHSTYRVVTKSSLTDLSSEATNIVRLPFFLSQRGLLNV